MRIATALSLALCLLSVFAPGADAGWLVETGFSSPAGIRASADQIVVYWKDAVIELTAGGAFKSAMSYEAAAGKIQLERFTNARDGFVATGVFIEGDDHHPMLMRVNAAGEVQWARSIEATWLSDMTVAVEATNGDIILATRTGGAMLLVRFSPTGQTKWSRTLDRTDVEDVKTLVATRDGGVLAITSALSRNGALTRLDANGKIVWDLMLGSADAGFGFYDAVELSDGGFIAAGRLRTYSTSNRDGWLVRVSPRGEIAWQKSIGGDAEDGLFSIVSTGSGNFAALGGTTSAAGDADTWIVRFAGDGRIQNEIAVGGASDDGPRGPHFAFATVSGDDLVFASPAFPDFLVGKIRSNAATCKVIRSIRTPERNPMASSMKSELVEGTVTPVIRPLVITASKARDTVKMICEWSDATTEAPVPAAVVPAETPDEEAVFADAVAKLLIDRKFRELDTAAAAHRDARAAFDSGRSKLFAFYEALARHASLVMLGEQKHRQLLDQWYAATRSQTSRIALAAQFSAAAERVRGAGFANTILGADGDRYHELNAQAIGLLRAAEQAGGCDAPCYHLQIRTAKLGGWSEPLQKLHAADPRYWEAFAPAALYLSENWGGERGDIAHFVQSWTTETTGELVDVLYALHYASWNPEVIYGDQPPPPPPDWTRMRKGFTDFQRLHPKSRLNAHRFAAAAYRFAKDRESARSLFKTPLLEWSPRWNVWASRSEYDRAREWALRDAPKP